MNKKKFEFSACSLLEMGRGRPRKHPIKPKVYSTVSRDKAVGMATLINAGHTIQDAAALSGVKRSTAYSHKASKDSPPANSHGGARNVKIKPEHEAVLRKANALFR